MRPGFVRSVEPAPPRAVDYLAAERALKFRGRRAGPMRLAGPLDVSTGRGRPRTTRRPDARSHCP